MEREARPKRYERAFAYYVKGAAVRVEDDEMAAILFLDKHPGWTYDDLVTAPEDVVAGLMALDLERARALKHA